MSDDLKRHGPEDPTKVNINQEWELSYWSNKFGISKEKLKEAVEAVGPMVSKIKNWLKNN
ncbi:DUF3606 domain-containing protein [Herbaspirillum sp.]|uniref:DUF3606 domain-containing protein n=1 Tax=Herbaspirillum sp. TaxID=1890675 RepID=UPI002590E5D5|nr:DUF3606 domain-containing protein [Herbaspirillum sp.]MCP3946158.1 DUF3606 domain-containing protein [Herbaspirillum sp.]